MSHIFISHSHEDVDFAEILQNRLSQEGLATWRDTDIGGAKDWRKEIDEAINKAFALIVIMTPEAKASEYVTCEWAFAWGAGVEVIPILLKRTQLHPRIEALQYLDFTNPKARPWDTLVELLHKSQSSRLQQVQPVHRVHAYSGLWEGENRFSRWKGFELGDNDTVYFHGQTFLLISADGKNGSGTEIGTLHINMGNYAVIYKITNQVNRANVTENGTLHMSAKVLSRTRIEENGEPPEPRFR